MPSCMSWRVPALTFLVPAGAGTKIDTCALMFVLELCIVVNKLFAYGVTKGRAGQPVALYFVDRHFDIFRLHIMLREDMCIAEMIRQMHGSN